MKFSSCFSHLKWNYHHISSLELCTFHKEYVGSLRSFQHSFVSLNNINKTCAPGHVLKKSFRNSKLCSTGSGFKRCFSKYVSPNKNSIYFDTHLMVTDLQKCGFSLEQSEVITSAITDVVHSAVGNVKGDSVLRVEQEQLEVRLKSLIEKVRNDMIILEKTEFVRMKDECAKLKSEVAALKLLLQPSPPPKKKGSPLCGETLLFDHFPRGQTSGQPRTQALLKPVKEVGKLSGVKEEVVKLKSSQALDTSLERSRVKEEFQFRDQKIKDNNNRIDTEVARVETKIEAQKLDLLKYLVGSVLSLTTISLAFWRFFRM